MFQPPLAAKRQGEVILVPFDFFDQMVFGETLTFHSVAVNVFSGLDLFPSDILEGIATVSGSILTQKIKGGMAGVTYLLTAGANGSSGNSYKVTQLLSVISITGFAPSSVPVLSGSLPDGMVGAPYSANLTISGGYLPYEPVGLIAGAPAWMGFTVTDNLLTCHGLPDEPAVTNYVFSPTILDAALTPASSLQNIDIFRVFITGDAPNGTVGSPYSYTYTFGSGTPPYSFAAINGSVPAGTSMNPATGTISGTPTTQATYTWDARITDANGVTAVVADSANIVGVQAFVQIDSSANLLHSSDGGLTWPDTVATGGSASTVAATSLSIGNGSGGSIGGVLHLMTPITGQYSLNGSTFGTITGSLSGTGFPMWTLYTGTEWLRRSVGGLFASANGIAFVSRTIPSIGTPNESYRGVAKLGNIINSVAVSGATNRIIRSDDNGATWVVANPLAVAPYTSIVATSNRFLAFRGSSGAVDMSPTGADGTWTLGFATIPTPNFITGSAYSPTLNRVVVVTDVSGAIHYSNDNGATWLGPIFLPSWSTGFGGKIIWAGDKFILTHSRNGTHSGIFTSPDGIVWTNRYVKTYTSTQYLWDIVTYP